MPSVVWSLMLAATLQVTPAPPQQSAPSPWPDDKPFTRLLPNLVDDLRALPSSDTGFVLAGGLLGAAVTHPADDNAARRAREAGPSDLAEVGRAVGDGWVQGGIAVGAYAIGHALDHAEATHVGSDLVRAQVLNALITRAAKIIVNRDRPSGGNHAMPSGHTSATFTTAAVLERHYGWGVGIPAYAVASFVGWSSVRTEAHWITDVIIGATVGTIVGRTVTRGHRERDWALVPVRTDGGLALFFVRH